MVTDGLAVGFCRVVLLNPVAGDQDQELTEGIQLPFNTILLPIQILSCGPASAIGGARIVKLVLTVSGPHSFLAISWIVCGPFALKPILVGEVEVDEFGLPLLNDQL